MPCVCIPIHVALHFPLQVPDLVLLAQFGTLHVSLLHTVTYTMLQTLPLKTTALTLQSLQCVPSDVTYNSTVPINFHNVMVIGMFSVLDDRA